MNLSLRDEAITELMDDPECDPARLAATLRRFGTINRLVSGWAPVYRAHVRPFLRSLPRPARVLDLGCGGGDLIARLAEWTESDGLDATWVGADPDPRAHAVAAARAVPRNVTFVCADAHALRRAGDRFDIVVSNHVLHHLTGDALTSFVADSMALTSGIVLHGDIARSRLAYALYAIGITPFSPGTFLRTDGLRSIRRSFRPEELRAALGSGWQIRTPAPFRVLAVSGRDG